MRIGILLIIGFLLVACNQGPQIGECIEEWATGYEWEKGKLQRYRVLDKDESVLLVRDLESGRASTEFYVDQYRTISCGAM